MRYTKNILKTLLAATLLTLLMTLAGCDNRPYDMGCYPGGYYGYNDYGRRHSAPVFTESNRGGRGNWGHGHEYASHSSGRRH